MVYVQIHFGKLYVYTPSKISLMRKDSNFNFHWAFKTWQTSDPPKVMAALLKYSTGWTFILMFHNLFTSIITIPICATCIEMLTFHTFLRFPPLIMNKCKDMDYRITGDLYRQYFVCNLLNIYLSPIGQILRVLR